MSKMKPSDKTYLVIFLTCFTITWLCYIFWLEKDEFDFEYREKETTNAIIFDLYTNIVEEEINDHRQIKQHEINYLEYSYIADGIEYTNSGKFFNGNYSVSDLVQIEYVKNNPKNSRIKGQIKFSYNYFIRNIIMVAIFSLLMMFGIISLLDFLKNKLNKENSFIQNK